MVGKDFGVHVEGTSVSIGESGQVVSDEFYQAMDKTVKVVDTAEYWSKFPDDCNIAVWGANITRTSQGDGRVDNAAVYINKDLLEGYSDGIVQCIVRHELAEIWSYAKKGKSLVEELENSRIDRVLARSIAHRFARMEEIKYAFENGFDTELFEFAKTHYDDFEEFDLFFSYYKDGIWSYEKSKGGKI